VIMIVTDLQNRVNKFIEENGLETSLETRLLDLLSEVGELAKATLKGTNYGKESFEVTDAWRDEFGDVLFAIFVLAKQTDVSVEDALLAALKKYEGRIKSSGEVGSDR